MRDHGEALEFDLMRFSGFTLDDLGRGLSESALFYFVQHVPMESAFAAEIDSRFGWSRTEQLLARLVEAVERLDYHFLCKGQKRHRWPDQPERIPRPGVESEEKVKRIGSDPIPIAEFNDWYYGKGGD